MFICTGCQKEYENQTKFCSECGGKVEEKIETAPPVYACSQCGKEYDETTKFCSECGGKVISKTATVQPATVQPVAVQPAPVQPAAVQPVPGIDKKTVKKNKMKIILSIIGSVIVIGGIVFNIFRDDIQKAYEHEKVTKKIVKLCEQNFNCKPYKVSFVDDDVYKLIIGGEEDAVYFRTAVYFRYDKKNNKIVFASDDDNRNWKEMIALHKISKIDTSKGPFDD